MREIVNITSDSHQRHTVILSENEIILTIRFYPTVSRWFFDVEYKTKTINGLKMSLGTFHMLSANLPFDFIVTDETGNGVDPFRVDDFEQGRCKLYILDPEEMANYRGFSVEI